MEYAALSTVTAALVEIGETTESVTWATAAITLAVYGGRLLKDLTMPLKDLVLAVVSYIKNKDEKQLAELEALRMRVDADMKAMEEHRQFQQNWNTSMLALAERVARLEGPNG